MKLVRLPLTLLLVCVASCAAPPPRSIDLDAIDERRRTREASPGLEGVEGLDLGRAVRLLAVLDPELRLAFARALPAEEAAEFAMRWPDPSLGFDLVEGFSGGAVDEWGAMLQLPLAIAGRRTALRDSLDAEARAALAAAEARLFERARDLEADWLAWSRTLGEAELADELSDSLDGPLGRVEILEAAGALDRVQGGLLRLAQVDARRSANDARQRALDLELELRHALGLGANGSIPLIPAELTPGPALADERRSPGPEYAPLAAARAAFDAADAEVQVAHRARFVRPQLGLGAGEENGGSRGLLGVQIPLPLWNRGLGRLARSVADRELAARAVEVAFERAQERIERARRGIVSARSRRAPLEDPLLPLAETQVDTLGELLELGDLRPFLLVEALERRRDAQVERLSLLEEETRHQLVLDAIFGRADLPTPRAGDQP